MYKIPANTLFIGKNLVFVPECHSTNDLALQLSHESATPEGTVVITNHQVAGRGQRGNAWEAQPGQNFTLSLLLKPGFLAVRDQFYLNIFTSLAIREYIQEKTTQPVTIKWPNDVLVCDKKVCGILIENQLQGSRFLNTIIGIGLNMNQKTFGVDTASSVSVVTGQDFDLVAELEYLLVKIEQRYLQLRQQQVAVLMKDYLSTLYWIGEHRTFSALGVEFKGTISGLHETGKLVIETQQGARYFDIKEVVYVK